MSTPGTHSRSPIGLDIGSARIKAAQVVRARRGWRVASSASFERIDPSMAPTAGEIDRLVGVLDRAGFTGDRVVVGAPRKGLRTAVLDLPPKTSGAPIEQICAGEFARMFRLPPASYELFAWEMPTATDRGAKTQMSACALECAHAEALVAPLQAVGLQVDAIDLAAEATSRACRAACTHKDGLTALLDVGSAGVDLMVFRQGELIYQRWLDGVGLGRPIEALSRSLGVTERAAQAVVRRVGLAGYEAEAVDPVVLARMLSIMREYVEHFLRDMLGSVSYVLDRFPGMAVTRLRLVGGGAVVPQLPAYLSEMAGLDAQRLTPRECGFSAGAGIADPGMHTALGHALWGVL